MYFPYIPKNIDKYNISEKKKVFLTILLPIALRGNELVLEERKVKALERIANVLDALTLWFEDIDKNEWGDRLAWYMHEWYTKYIENDDKQDSK